MAREGREQGIRSPQTVRFGPSNPYSGVNKQADAASIPETQGVEGINLRIGGGIPKSRHGFAKVNASALPDIHGFHDTLVERIPAAPFEGGKRYIYFLGTQADGQTPVVFEYDTQTSTPTAHQLGETFDSSAAPQYILEPLQNGGLTIAADGKLYIAAKTYDPGTGNKEPVILQVNRSTWAVVAFYTEAVSSTYFFSAPVEDAANPGVFFTSKGPANASLTQNAITYRITGLAAGAADDNPTSLGTAVPDDPVYGFLVAFNNTIVAVFGDKNQGLAAPDTIRRRTGAATWANLTLPSPPDAGNPNFDAMRALVYGGNLYVAGRYADVANVDAPANLLYVLKVTTGYVVTVAHHISGALSAETILAQMVEAGGYLYYIWGGNGTSLRLGRFDGTTWDDDHAESMGPLDQNYAGPVLAGESLYLVSDDRVLRSNGSDTTQWSVDYVFSGASAVAVPGGTSLVTAD